MAADRDTKDLDGAMDRWNYLVQNNDMKQEEVMKHYSSWAPKYDEDSSITRTIGRAQLAARLPGYLPEGTDRSTIKILDIAAGTGLTGVEFHKLGFTSMDALDGCQEMLDMLKTRNIYDQTYCALIGNDQKIEGIEDGTYDVVTNGGGFAHAHLPVDCLREVARVLKKGGLFLNTMTEKYLTSVKELRELEPLMKKMEEEGVWKMLDRFPITEDIPGVVAIHHIFKKL